MERIFSVIEIFICAIRILVLFVFSFLFIIFIPFSKQGNYCENPGKDYTNLSD